MITDNTKKSFKDLVTKKDLSSEIKKVRIDLSKDINQVRTDLSAEIVKTRYELKHDMQELSDRFDQKFDMVLNGIDKVMGELKTARIEREAHLATHDRIDKDLRAIKSVPVIAQALSGK